MEVAPIRILAISPYGREGRYSGPAVFFRRLFSEVGKSVEVVVVTASEAPPSGGYEWASRTVPLASTRNYGALAQVRWFCSTLIYVLIRSRKSDVVHLHGGFLFNLGGAVGALLRRRPFVILPLSAKDLSKSSTINQIPGVEGIKRHIISRASHGLSLSEEITRGFSIFGLPRGRITPINNSVSRAFADLPLGVNASDHGLLFIGGIGRPKGAHLVLEALHVLLSAGWRAHATFIGPFVSPQERIQFEQAVDTLGLADCVTVTGHVDGDVNVAAAMLMSKCSVFVLPSTTEGMPGSLAEAMTMGLPCVVTDAGSMGAVARLSGGGVVIKPESQEIANAVSSWWAQPDSWKRASNAARAFAHETFSAESVAEQYIRTVSSRPEGSTL